MTRGQFLLMAVLVWLVVLGILLQPSHDAPPPTLSHAQQLEPSVKDLPTLVPLQP